MSTLPPPIDCLTSFVKERVVIKCRNGRLIKAVLIGFDEHLNMVLSDVEERNGDALRDMPMLYMRGDAVLMISRPKQ